MNNRRLIWAAVAALAVPVLLISADPSDGISTPAIASPSPAEGPYGITVEEVSRQGDRAVLKVHNRTPFLVIMHVGGVRVGWMRPQRTGLVRGLASGYHKLYAHSRHGSMSWGPKDVWVPGDWNLVE